MAEGEDEMRRHKNIFCFTLFLMVFIFSVSAYAQQPPASETAGGVARQEQEIEAKKKLEKKIESERPKPEGTATEDILPEDSGPRVLVNTITVEGASLLTNEEIKKITADFEGKELSLKAIQKIADLITDEYRLKGYVTSRAYIPPQTIKEGVLIIKVIEGKLGSVDIRGNRYFKTSLLERKLDLESAGYFDYSALQNSLVYINEHPDRKARATLVPGKEPGTTDVVIDVEDRFPFHVSAEYDNYGSRYIGKDRYALVLEHNNLLGFDDKAYFKLQYSEGFDLKLQQGRYSYPLSQDVNIGAYFLRNSIKLGEEFEDVDSRGKAKIYGVFLNSALITEPDLDLRLNLGFDYKSVKNYLLGDQLSRDEVRVAKAGLDLDANDAWGRNVITGEFDLGIPDIMGGMENKDPDSSRDGAGGKFNKWLFNYYRLQSMPFETSLLWKNSAQYSTYNLVASEEFQIGGPASVRGYTPAEYSGDRGFYTSPELSIPWYFISKDSRIPYTENSKWYDALRFVLFYDWATAKFNTAQPGEKKSQTIRGYGYGLRLNIKDNVSFRVEVGYPEGKTPSDGDHAHPWVELILKY
jgi:hemolysin activation/secretion protein